MLRMFPRQFRDEFGDEMVAFYRARRTELRHRDGLAGSVRLWAHLLADAAISAIAEHWRAVRRARPESVSWASPDYPQETRPMQTLAQDLRYGLRSLAQHPGFALVASLTLAIGIGATTAIYSVVDAVLLRPLPWPDSERLVLIFGTRGGNQQSVVYLDYRDWRDNSNAFEELGTLRGQSVNLTGGETPDRLFGSFVTAGTLRALGASTVGGRLLTDSETEVATREPSAVISEAVWRTRFGSRPDVLGSSLTINGQPFNVVGIMRPGFNAPLGTPDVWLPVGYYPNQGDLTQRGRGGILVVGKLKPGVTVERGQQDLDAIARRLAAQFPSTNEGTGAAVLPLKEQIAGPSRTPLYVMFGAVASVLLIACANVANLHLARATVRARELTVRAALGASRRRLIRQLLTESLVLSLAGGLAGLALAALGVRWFAQVVPGLLTLYGTITLDAKVLLFAAAVTVATGILFGVAPAWRSSRTRLQDTLTQRSGGGFASLRLHHALIGAQIAMCVVLLVSAGLLTRSLIALSRANTGFDADRLLTMQFRLPVTTYDSEAKIASMFARTIAEIRTVPGVEHAALVRATPLNGNGETLPYEVDGATAVERDRLPRALRNIVTPGYFETMRIARLSGRDFTEEDRLGTAPVVIVNDQLAKKLSPSGSALGMRVRLLDGGTPVWASVVGVVGNTRHFQVNEQPLDQVYFAHAQEPLIFTEVVARSTADDPMSIANAVRAAIWRVDRDQPVWAMRPVLRSIENGLGARTFTMRLLAGFALIALTLAMIGVYGVMSYAVARRSQEMGIRLALGASAGQVVGMVVRQGMRTVGIAIVIGLGASMLVTRVLESQLYGVGRADPLTLASVPLALGIVALAACWIPARRASRVDPVEALRSD
jgi:putative ABC transport system permease protein